MLDMTFSILSPTPFEAKRALGGGFRKHRLAANITQKDLAERSGVSEATIKRIEASGSASLKHVLMVGFALGLGSVFTNLPAPKPRSIDDVVESRGRRRGGVRPVAEATESGVPDAATADLVRRFATIDERLETSR